MRLGKVEAAGYVEDVEETAAREAGIPVQPEPAQPAPAAEAVAVG